MFQLPEEEDIDLSDVELDDLKDELWLAAIYRSLLP